MRRVCPDGRRKAHSRLREDSGKRPGRPRARCGGRLARRTPEPGGRGCAGQGAVGFGCVRPPCRRLGVVEDGQGRGCGKAGAPEDARRFRRGRGGASRGSAGGHGCTGQGAHGCVAASARRSARRRHGFSGGSRPDWIRPSREAGAADPHLAVQERGGRGPPGARAVELGRPEQRGSGGEGACRASPGRRSAGSPFARPHGRPDARVRTICLRSARQGQASAAGDSRPGAQAHALVAGRDTLRGDQPGSQGDLGARGRPLDSGGDPPARRPGRERPPGGVLGTGGSEGTGL